MMLVYFQKFVVEGSGRFPYDMLRYDHCYPYSESEDSPQLGYDYDGPKRRVTVARWVENRNQEPTEGRWRSFDWRVVPGTLETKKL